MQELMHLVNQIIIHRFIEDIQFFTRSAVSALSIKSGGGGGGECYWIV